jgi:hypothetical protein
VVAGCVLLAGCGGNRNASGTSGMYAGIERYEAQAAAKRALADKTETKGTVAEGKALFAGEATQSRYPDGSGAAWRIVLTDIDEHPTDLCVWVSAEGPDPLNYTVFSEFGRCSNGGATS